jgi:hypothetical protein
VQPATGQDAAEDDHADTDKPGLQAVPIGPWATASEAINGEKTSWEKIPSPSSPHMVANWPGGSGRQRTRPASSRRWDQQKNGPALRVAPTADLRASVAETKTEHRQALRPQPRTVRRSHRPRYRPTLVDPYRDHLRRRRSDDPGVPVTHLLHEIRELGYTGERAYARPYRSEQERRDAYPQWLHTYDHRRGHSALAGKPPAGRVPDLTGQCT